MEAVVSNPRLTLVGAAIEAYNRRDLSALRDLMTEDVELRPPVSALTGRAYQGHEGIGEWLRDVEESFSTARIEPMELRNVGDFVVALTEFQVEGQESRMALGSELGLLCSIEGGRISRWVGFFNHAAAIEAAVGQGDPGARGDAGGRGDAAL